MAMKASHPCANHEDKCPAGGPEKKAAPACGRCEQRPAASRCETCQAMYCQECRTEVHKGVLTHHTFAGVDSAAPLPAQCEEHDAPLEQFCPACPRVVCSVCADHTHKDHACRPLAEATELLPPIAQLEAGLQAAAAEVARALAVLRAASRAIEKDTAESVQRVTEFLRRVEANAAERAAAVGRQEERLAALRLRIARLLAMLPEAAAAAAAPSAWLQVHCLAVGLMQELQRVEVTEPPLLSFVDASAEGALSPGSVHAVLPPLPKPTDGTTHRLQHLTYVPAVPAFRSDPKVPSLLLTNDNRRCRLKSGSDQWVLALAKDGFASGFQQFTVHVIDPFGKVVVGVAQEATPGSGSPFSHGLFLSSADGTVSSPDQRQPLPYASKNCMPRGTRVRVQLDFSRLTITFALDGRSLGPVPCPLPPGVLYPAVMFKNGGTEVEFVN